MPYGWVDPEVYLKHRGVTVYYTYRNDHIDDSARAYQYTLDPSYGEDHGEEEGVFEVFDFDNPKRHDLETDNGREALIRELIEQGVLSNDEGNYIRRAEESEEEDADAD